MVRYTRAAATFKNDIFIDKLDTEIRNGEGYIICGTFIDKGFEAGKSP